MKILALTLVLAAAAIMGGCGSSQTPEEIEAAKYPKAPPLTPEEQEKAKALSKSLPPPGTPRPN